MKIYVHHYYSYELFWFFFHASKPLQEIPTWFQSNRYNKNNLVSEEVSIKIQYSETEFEVIFCGDNNWQKKDGYHVFSYTINQLETKKIGDRGWNTILGKDLESDIIPMLNKHNSKVKGKISIFFIDWEYGVPGQSPIVNHKLNKEITIFKDELIDISDSQMVSFTHILWSFIFPNTINLREYYYFAEYLKYKKDYKYKVNYPVRRITTEKYNYIKKINSFNNPNLNCTVSSFTNYYKHDRNDIKDILIEDVINLISDKNLINKRGYNLDDWGGEYNDDNMKEFMYKLFTISEVTLLHEASTGYNINEKSFSHILANKPFVSISEGTYNFYNEIFKSYGYEVSHSPTHGLKRKDKLDFLNEITKDDIKWETFVKKLSFFIGDMRKKLLEIMHTKNGYLDYLIKRETETKSLL